MVAVSFLRIRLLKNKNYLPLQIDDVPIYRVVLQFYFHFHQPVLLDSPCFLFPILQRRRIRPRGWDGSAIPNVLCLNGIETNNAQNIRKYMMNIVNQ